MSQQNSLDNLQTIILRRKSFNFFKRMTDIYKNPNSSGEIVNQGISIKISQSYHPTYGFSFSERNYIAQKLSKIKFFVLFTSLKTTAEDKKIFFLLKTPSNLLDERNFSSTQSFIEYSLKKYASISSFDKLVQINAQLKGKLTNTQAEFKKIIYDLALEKGNLMNKLTSFFQDSDTKSEIAKASELKKSIENSEYTILAEEEFNIDDLEGLIIIKSVLSQYK